MQGIPLRPDYAAAQRAAADLLTRAAIAAGVARFDSSIHPAEYARKTWGNDSRPVQYIVRAASSPAMTTTTGWAAELAHTAQQFIGLLVPESAGADLLGRGIQVRFEGLASVSFPTITQSASGFVGQGKPIPVVQYTTGAGVKLEPHGFKVITTATREMLESGNAEIMMRTNLVEAAALGLDGALFSANAGTADAPAGLLNGIVATTSSTTTPITDAMTADLAKLAGSVARVAGGSSNITFIAAPEQEAFIKTYAPQFGYPVLGSSALAAKTVIAVANNAIVSGYEPLPTIDASREATLHWDTQPSDIVGSGGVVASPVGSLLQTDRIALRMRMPVAWVLRASNAIAFVNNASWPA
jgi:hypothetical protein